ncbi:MAG: undecaprenyldiphospho-muramoylpentapeptide beta-N-acetylglucosaminyltransferase [Methylobacter sp.]|nr:undecaprenyldiphospho-muramoylpentapeptide beta-N-acetylglucosaminyltransferase [Methylobacter sp.]MDP2098238.1 undecaprenyldiphospho-muramoylpentapeptide beta-N-acetylglucosaminyltransferase [Methylobacter sp.]MDP2426735.1 undecaprenyldiphospho-muramoylpentapeptide beta-N-acetylglucosaminyltransferase [Methylobacter sp.]MDP3054715.1 undecaprenyldiphospho-muramoylpentapeptide beta-N-acetylglucosaminyltransferase [Methylobacter sp.]MDP3361767.1 undecaprenyldiphospho-muramoylpentapeptide beta-
MAKRIIIMAGGTGGHVFPALAVAQALQEKGWQVSWLGTQKGLESRVIPEQGIDIDWLSVAGVRGKGVWSKITALLLLLKACSQAEKILRQRKPDVVLGMGGFVAGPGGLMAKLLGIPLVIHEQNRVPGTTNRLLARVANQVLEAFPGSFNNKINAQFTGNPLRKPFTEYAERLGIHAPIRLLIVGGSQGAKALNEIVPEAIAAFGGDVAVKHQTGAAMQEQVDSHYKQLGVAADVQAFIEDMASAYQWADLVICRSGAMTISEVAAAGVPAIFIPLPNAIDDHQTANARYLTDAGAGLLLRQKELTVSTLVEQITQVIKQWDVMSNTAKQYARLDATDIVAAVCSTEAGL